MLCPGQMFSTAEMPVLFMLLMLFSNLGSLQHLIDLTRQQLLGKGNTEQVGEGNCFKKRNFSAQEMTTLAMQA